MAKTVQDILEIIKEKDIKMVDFKMVDINGQYRHVTIPAENFSEDTMKSGIGFDASNYGYAVVEKSDMVFIPDPDTAMVDPFCSIPTLSMTGNAMIIDSPENRPLAQYPRNIINAAVAYMKNSGVADEMKILPEFEFYLFDNVAWNVDGKAISATVDAKQSYWNSQNDGLGVIVAKQKNYHIAKPFDISYECRSEMCMLMKEAGIEINYHHPEVAASGQFEIEPQLGEVVHMADATMMIKYIIHNTALKYGKSATFMPKPIYGEAGSGMHVHMLLFKDDATSNRSAVIRIPAYAKSPDKRRFELRNPDATCNPYFCYAAILMAGLDGIKNKIDPHANGWGPYDMNLYNLPEEEKAKLKGLPTSLDEALDCLEKDHDYLTEGGVFPIELINNLIKTKRAEIRQLAAIPHPAEFEKYYNL